MQISKEPEYEVVKKQLSKNQKDWIKYFNDKKTKMISAPDIYKVAKQENKTIIESLKKDFKENYEITSTRIIYNKDNLDAEIIHDADSKIIKPKNYKVNIPDLSGNFKEDSEIEKYLQALFDTKDSLDKIIEILKKFGKKRKLRLWTPSQSSRKDKQVRSVEFVFDGFEWFGVGGVWFGGGVGLSRGVIIDSAKQSKKSRGKSK